MKTADVIYIEDYHSVARALRETRRSVGMCHGCFDVVHFGHLIHFNEAASLCDILVVSITPDEFVNKGPTRPIFSTQRRAYFLSNIRSIDYVVVNNTVNAIHPLSVIQPKIYFKGSDYIDNTSSGFLMEKKFCADSGVELKYTIGDRFSSSETLKLLRS